MPAISVQLPLAESDSMSDLLETKGGGCRTLCMENLLHSNRMLWLNTEAGFGFDAAEAGLIPSVFFFRPTSLLGSLLSIGS